MSVKNPASLNLGESEAESSCIKATRTSLLSKRMLSDLLAIYDFGSIILTALVSYYSYIVFYLNGDSISLSYAIIIAMTAIIFFATAKHRQLYNLQVDFSVVSQISSIIYICALAIALDFVILFFLKFNTEFSRIWLLSWVSLLIFVLSIGRVVFARYLEVLIMKGALRRSIALIGSGNQFRSMKAALNQDKNHFRLTSALDLPAPDITPSSQDSALAAAIQGFIKEAQANHVDEVIIALPAANGKDLEQIVQQVQMLPVDVRVLPDFGGANISVMHVEEIADHPIITTVSKPIAEWGAFVKSIEDYVIGSLCLFLFAPAMALIAIAIKLDSKGPVFFRQRRHGYNHRVVEVLKFRTMTVLEDGDVITQATKDDKRITRAGAFLRRTSLDELPQFWNIVCGEMSVVGPRPHALAHNTYYGDLIENYANRHRVKPGITGWAQVHGFRGETTDAEMMARRVRYDLDYIENWSIWLDLKIILMTPLFGLFRSGAY